MPLSFEIFPPKTPHSTQTLTQTLSQIANQDPDFVSVTCGAQGSAREGTHEWVGRVQKMNMRAVAHVTSAYLSECEIKPHLNTLEQSGAAGIVALRGDLTPGGRVKTDVTKLIENGFGKIWVSGYPTPHPESKGRDFEWLLKKQECGAHEIITQFVFDPYDVVRFRDKVVAHNITMPVRPGLMAFHNWAGAVKFANATGVPVHQDLKERFETSSSTDQLADDTARHFLNVWRQNGILDAHIYTLNKPTPWCA